MPKLGRYIKKNGKDYEWCDWNTTRWSAVRSLRYIMNKGAIVIHEVKDKSNPRKTLGWVTYKPI
jgi:hypothetical protein